MNTVVQAMFTHLFFFFCGSTGNEEMGSAVISQMSLRKSHRIVDCFSREVLLSWFAASKIHKVGIIKKQTNKKKYSQQLFIYSDFVVHHDQNQIQHCGWSEERK